jgi:hypothetical protein
MGDASSRGHARRRTKFALLESGFRQMNLPMRVGPSENAGTRRLALGVAASTTMAALATALGGCGASIDMAASASGAQRATMTVPYTDIREEVRLYPDYGPIGASILAADDAAKDDKRPASPKKSKP